MNREEAILAAIEFFEQPNSKDHWEYNKTTREEIVAALRTRPEAEPKHENFKAIGFVDRDGGVKWEPNERPGDQPPGALLYVYRP